MRCWPWLQRESSQRGIEAASAALSRADNVRCGLFKARKRLHGTGGRSAEIGGAEGNRTPDLLIANEALSHLSYGPAGSAGGADNG